MLTSKNKKPLLLVVTGPTATGKTSFAAHLALRVNGEVISADSRQVYRGMDLATGKDFTDYIVDGTAVPYHLVDIVEPGYEYNVFEFKKDFNKTYDNIVSREKTPVLCGGTGLYIEAVLRNYPLHQAPVDKKLREQLTGKSEEELISMLRSMKSLHNITDTDDRDRLERAIEIAMHTGGKSSDLSGEDEPGFDYVIFGVHFERQQIRERITERLSRRLESGMTKEVEVLLEKGLTPGQLKFYGLEYRFLTQYVTGEISFDEMFRLLNTAIHQFAKRQMTWFRRMEKKGLKIHWLDGTLSNREKTEQAISIIKKYV